MKNIDENSIINNLSKLNGVRVNKGTKTIEMERNNTGIGIKTLGKIDYLCKKANYTLTYVDTINHIVRSSNNEENYKKRNKQDKQDKKIDMAKMTKIAMKRMKSK